MRNDPYYKAVQKNLTQMFKVAVKEDSSTQSMPKSEGKEGEERDK